MTVRRPQRRYTPRRAPEPPDADRARLARRCGQVSRRLGVLAASEGGEVYRPEVERVRAEVARLDDPAARLRLLTEARERLRPMVEDRFGVEGARHALGCPK